MQNALAMIDVQPGRTACAARTVASRSILKALAMALVHPHKILLLDEPVAGVNPVVRDEIKKILRDLRKSGETILLIEHDMHFVMDLADHVVVMDGGKLLTQGTPREIQNSPEVLEAYLGEQL